MDGNNNMNELFLLEMGFDKRDIKDVLSQTSDIETATALLLEIKENSKKEYGDDYKMVIIVRDDLKLSTGKIAAQVGHGVLQTYKLSLGASKNYIKEWEDNGSKKVVLKVQNEDLLMVKYNKAKTLGIPCSYIRDAGRTEVDPFTITVCAFGPWISTELNEVTGDLSLLK